MEEILIALDKLKNEKKIARLRLNEINKTILEYEMKLFLLSTKKEKTSDANRSLIKRIEKKIHKKFKS